MSPGKRQSLLKALAGVVLLASLAGAVALNLSARSRARVDQPAPAWTAQTLDGRQAALADFRGRAVLFNLWTTWCVTCKEETPALQAFHERYGDRVAVVGMDVREPVRLVRDYIQRAGITYTVVRDPRGRVADRYNLRGYPETWFIDAQGMARAFWSGPLTFEQMQVLAERAAGAPLDPGAGPLLTAAADPARPGEVWRAGTEGLGRGGEKVHPGRFTALALPPAAPGLVLAAGPEDGVQRSPDGGRTWQEAGRGLPERQVTALAADPRGRTLFAWVAGHGLFRSGDGGGSWQAVAGGLDARLPVVALALDPGDPAHLLAAWARGDDLQGWSGQLLESRDGGRTFAAVPVEEEILDIRTRPAVFGIAFDAGRPGRVFLATARGVWAREAGGSGAAWLRGSPARRFLAVSAAGGAVVAAAPDGDVYVSRDGGATWSLAGGGEGGGR